MPFTPMHALAAVPFARARWLCFSALVVGTMIPDLWAFLPGAPSYAISHAWGWGSLTGLAYGIPAFVLFRLCRRPAIAFVPETMRRRLVPYAAADLRMSATQWLSVAISISLGVWTHILWDSFTHAHRLGAALVPQLSEVWLTLWGRPLRGYNVLQLGSSVLGFPIMAWRIVRWYASLPSTGAGKVDAASDAQRALAIVLLVGAPIAVIYSGWSTVLFAESRTLERIVRYLLTTTITLYLAGVVALTLPSQLMAWSRRTARDR